tara:strand:- start:274 stop:1044 length:771 start_codon:yes stop_codon:yes gene_type:complete
MKTKKAQVTIYILIAVLLITVLLVFFYIFKETKKDPIPPNFDNPQSYIESCVGEIIENSVELIRESGGYYQTKNFKLYQGRRVPYLCYQDNFYYQCVNQEPMLMKHIEEEIMNHTKQRIGNCFIALKAGLEDKNYEVDMQEKSEMNFSVNIVEGLIVTKIDRNFVIKIREEEQRFEKFDMILNHPMYDLVRISQEIVNQEAIYCNFDYLGYMIFYPDYDIRKFLTGDDVKIYTVKDIKSEKDFEFAIRSCAIPAGL